MISRSVKEYFIKISFISFILSLCLFNQVLHAQDTDGVLDEIIVACQFRADERVPISYQDISKEYLDSINFGQEPSFILGRTPSVTVYSDSGAYQGYSYFRMRGIDQTRINMTLDGVPLNEPEDQGVYFSNYPDFFSSINGIQIQRGVGTTKNGTASYAGSIEFHTPDLTRRDEPEIQSGFGSYNSWRVMGEYQSELNGDNAFYIRTSQIKSDGYKYRSANDSKSIFISSEFYDDVSTWKVTGFVGEQKNQMAWLGVSEQSIRQDPRMNGNSEEDDKFSQALIILNNKREVDHNTDLSFSIYHNSLNGNYDFDLNNFLGFPSTSELYNYALESSFTGFLGNINFTKDDLDLTVGLHINQYSRRHIGSERTLGELYRNTGYRNSSSVFIKTLYDAGNIIWFADIQFRRTDFDYQGSVNIDKMEWSFVNPKLGLNIELTDNLNLYYSVGRTGREPTRTDVFGGNDNLELGIDGNPLLFITREEYVLDHELGIRYRAEKLNLDLNYYYMDFDDEIVLNGQFGPNGLALNDDVDSSVRSGIELLSIVDLNPKWDMSTAISWSRSEINDSGQIFKHILSPEWVVNHEFTYQFNKISAGISLRYQGNAYLDFANSEKLNSFSTVNAQFSYQSEKWALKVFINNLLDKDFYANGLVDFNGIPKYFIAAPTNYQSTLSYYF